MSEGGGKGWKFGSLLKPLPKASIFVGVGILGALQVRHILRRDERSSDNTANAANAVWSSGAVGFVCSLPTRALSRLWGQINKKELPASLRSTVLGTYSNAFNCNMSEAQRQSFDDYSCLQDFFTRRLVHGARPVANAFVNSPADSRVLACGVVDRHGQVEQVKGVTYPVEKLLGESLPALGPGRKYMHCVLYLAPGDYHRFHAPVAFNCNRIHHIPGELLSVAPRVAKVIPDLFALNERVVLAGEWDYGACYYVAVGAYNVGSILIHANEDIHTNTSGPLQKKTYPSNQERIQRGEEVGTFMLGSTIILVLEAPEGATFTVNPGEKLQCGQEIMSLSSDSLTSYLQR